MMPAESAERQMQQCVKLAPEDLRLALLGKVAASPQPWAHPPPRQKLPLYTLRSARSDESDIL